MIFMSFDSFRMITCSHLTRLTSEQQWRWILLFRLPAMRGKSPQRGCGTRGQRCSWMQACQPKLFGQDSEPATRLVIGMRHWLRMGRGKRFGFSCMVEPSLRKRLCGQYRSAGGRCIFNSRRKMGEILRKTPFTVREVRGGEGVSWMFLTPSNRSTSQTPAASGAGG